MPIPFHWNTPYIYSFAKSMKEAICHEENDQIHISFYGCYPVLQSRVFSAFAAEPSATETSFSAADLATYNQELADFGLNDDEIQQLQNITTKLQTQLPCVKLMP